jgi:alpha-glucosidase
MSIPSVIRHGVSQAGIALTLAVAASSAAAAAPPAGAVASVASPGDVLAVELLLEDGRPSYRVMRFGEPVIGASRLGFVLKDSGKLDRNFELTSQQTRTADDTWEQPYGERRFVRNHYNELRLRLTEKSGARRALDVVFRVYDDGLGFRYEFPDQPTLKEVVIDDELTEFAVVAPATAWWIPAGQPDADNDLEILIHRTPLAELSATHTPLTIRTEDGLHIAFHEAALVDYAAMHLARVDGQRLRAALAPASEGWKVRRTAPFSTPWRTMQVADSAGGLYMSNLILNLNEPNAQGDVSWVKPGKFIGIWWEMHLDRWSWSAGPRHGATTANAKRYIDFAARNGIRGVLVEGWNLGWGGEWYGHGAGFSFTKPYPDFDLPAVVAYAREKGVHLIGHHETGGDVSNYETQLGAALDLYQRLGIDAVKTGYVTDANQIQRRDADGVPRREWHDSQFMARHYLEVVTEAAKRHIAVDSHEPIKDTGLRRTFPSWITREGGRGMEYNAWGRPVNPPEHEANLVFTRMLAGPFDFTPGIFALDPTRPCCRVNTTLAKQLALYVVLYSPLQMAADRIESYEAHPKPFQFIKDVPTDWAETLVLNGEIGDFATIARKDRNSADWYLGSITNAQGRLLSVSLGFLDSRRHYRAQIYRDGPAAHWKSMPDEIVIEERDVSSADTLTLRLAAGGGEAIRFVAVPAGRRPPKH